MASRGNSLVGLLAVVALYLFLFNDGIFFGLQTWNRIIAFLAAFLIAFAFIAELFRLPCVNTFAISGFTAAAMHSAISVLLARGMIAQHPWSALSGLVTFLILALLVASLHLRTAPMMRILGYTTLLVLLLAHMIDFMLPAVSGTARFFTAGMLMLLFGTWLAVALHS